LEKTKKNVFGYYWNSWRKYWEKASGIICEFFLASIFLKVFRNIVLMLLQEEMGIELDEDLGVSINDTRAAKRKKLYE
jgi:hypothetical protein